MTKIWWVEDYLSGAVIDNRHYATKEEAVERRGELGYGVVKSFEMQDGGVVCPGHAKGCTGCSS